MQMLSLQSPITRRIAPPEGWHFGGGQWWATRIATAGSMNTEMMAFTMRHDVREERRTSCKGSQNGSADYSLRRVLLT